METVIKKAIEGGYFPAESWIGGNDPDTGDYFMDSNFWQALGRACGWEEKNISQHSEAWYQNAITFHQYNLTQGFDKAVEYLKELTK